MKERLESSKAEMAKRVKVHEEKEQNFETQLAFFAGEGEMQLLKIQSLERRIDSNQLKLDSLYQQIVLMEDTNKKNEELKIELQTNKEEGESKLFKLNESFKEEKNIRKETERLAHQLQLQLSDIEKNYQIEKRIAKKEVEDKIDASNHKKELEIIIAEQISKEEEYQTKFNEVNVKISQFSGLMDRLIEENQRLKTEFEHERKYRPFKDMSDFNNLQKTHMNRFHSRISQRVNNI